MHASDPLRAKHIGGPESRWHGGHKTKREKHETLPLVVSWNMTAPRDASRSMTVIIQLPARRAGVTVFLTRCRGLASRTTAKTRKIPSRAVCLPVRKIPRLRRLILRGATVKSLLRTAATAKTRLMSSIAELDIRSMNLHTRLTDLPVTGGSHVSHAIILDRSRPSASTFGRTRGSGYGAVYGTALAPYRPRYVTRAMPWRMGRVAPCSSMAPIGHDHRLC